MRKDGRCVKKSYNPFKMWGSYAGAILGFLSFPIVFIGILSEGRLFAEGGGSNIGIITKILIFSPMFSLFDGTDAVFSLFFTMVLWYSIIGFLLGWGIHSLIRRFRR
ncbi:MAG: hypothetical protein AABY22_23340 [Nanoarchaeota archaeon]